MNWTGKMSGNRLKEFNCNKVVVLHHGHERLPHHPPIIIWRKQTRTKLCLYPNAE